MRKLSIAMLAALSTAAFAQIDHSQLITHPGGGTGSIAGGNLSMLQTTPNAETLFGFGAQGPPTNNIMADDFNAGVGFTITGITVFGYQTGAAAPSLTALNWAIGAAPTTTLTTTTAAGAWWNPGGQGVWRVNAGDTGSTGGIRRIQSITVTGLNINVAGTQWLSFSMNGTGASGPWAPPIPTSTAIANGYGLNAQQSIGGGAFAPGVNGTMGADLAFIIHGQPVPEPATMAVLGLGAAAMLRRRRAKK